MAAIPGALGGFQGFDDAQNLTGANLLQHGYFPWRDFQFIHGFYVDVLESLIGFHIFEATAWGSAAAYTVILTPLVWVSVYLLGVWAARWRSLIVLGTFALAAWGGLGLDPKFIAVPVVLMLLGTAIASHRLAWTSVLTVVLFIEGVAVPEADYQVIAVFLVLLIAELVHREPGQRLRVMLRRTLCFVGTGAILTAAWAVFLASQRALKGFIDWYVVFVPGHNAEGDIHPYLVSTFQYAMFGLMMGLAVATFLSAAWRIRYRRAWTPVAWATLAAALNAAVYGEQALARFDGGHVAESLDVGLSLIVLCIAPAVPVIEDFLVARVDRVWRLPTRLAWRPQPVAVIALIFVVVLVPTIRSNIWHAPRRTHVVLGPVETRTVLGYVVPGALEPGLVADLRTVVDTYSPRRAPFFDMTNSPGYFYFILGLRPATAFTNVSLAIPESAQRLLIDDLRRSRPPLIAFNSATIGLPVWDGVQNQVRHFLVSQYLLDGWTPIISTHGVLFLLRNDLFANRPPVPHLTQPPITTDLYNSQGTCSWGDTANFLSSPPVGASLTLHSQGVQRLRQVSLSGWAFDRGAGAPAKEIVVAVGDRAFGAVPIGGARPDVAAALHTPAATNTGFSGTVGTTASGPVSVYALTSDGALHLLPGAGNRRMPAVTSVRMPDGTIVRVGAAASGNLESGVPLKAARATTFKVPASVSLPAYQLVTFGASGRIGAGDLTLSDINDLSAGVQPGGNITAGTLPVTGSRLAVRVGSCLQWHGYHGRTLYLTQRGGRPITSLTLSDVEQ